MQKAWFIGLLTLWAVMAAGCGNELQDPDKEVKYMGPLRETMDVVTLYSDSARLLIKMTAPVQQDYENGDAVFPKGIYIEFYDKPGVITSTLKANYGKQDRNANLYHVRGNVVINNLQKNEKIETEELFWNRGRDRIYNEKFVKITTESEIITGYGLRTNQNFSPYSLKRLTGEFELEEE